MKKSFLAYSLLLGLLAMLHDVPVSAQANRNRFTLIGTINRPTGTIQLLPVGGAESHPATTGTYQTTIVNGRFTLTGEAPYPLAFLIRCPEYISNPFIVEAGTQPILCNADSLREIPRIDNQSMRELRAAPTNFFATLSLAAQRKKDLLAFVKQHPASYVGLWETVELLHHGYDPLLDSTYLAFTPTLKNTLTGKRLSNQLKASVIAAIGKPFPVSPLRTTTDQPATLTNQRWGRYTLVDFWFSQCGACIDQFPTLKTLFNRYSRTDFTIIQISIDKRAEKARWKKTIRQHALPWPQYLDEGGTFTTNTLSINSFPSNMLLDSQGRIIRKDVRMDELAAFLIKNVPDPARD